jgi:LysW-gamma-L-lysine carboxypeptidase
VEEESATSKGARHIAAEHAAPELCLIGEPSGWDALTLGYKGRVLLDYKLVLPCGHSAGPLAGAPEHAATFWQGVQAACDEANAGLDKLFDQVLPSLRRFETTSDGLHDTAQLTIGLRLPPGFDRDSWEARLVELAGNADLRLYGFEPAWRSERSSPLARAFLRAIRSQQGTPHFKVKTGTADLNVLGPVWGCPIAAYGPGDSTLDHTPDEHISITEYERAIAVLSAALTEAGFAS